MKSLLCRPVNSFMLISQRRFLNNQAAKEMGVQTARVRDIALPLLPLDGLSLAGVMYALGAGLI